MKRGVIMFCIIFAITIIIPAIVCFGMKSQQQANDMANIFRGQLFNLGIIGKLF